ncbi:hypothetical protein GCWU000282_01348 [Catonella morbi ATCC 51271]|uniref:Uncharacterized protein n=1 Tax=Catonella morbi ATCC 51271 TaxID=592026 RepID=V2Y311_9FIRM|nr:hypothetical protein GCWU000282_01348 [Catonella morbi ATCC 51271]
MMALAEKATTITRQISMICLEDFNLLSMRLLLMYDKPKLFIKQA